MKHTDMATRLLMNIQKLLCRLGLHRKVYVDKWIPSMYAEVVTDYKSQVRCTRPGCGEVFMRSHLQWNGTDMVEVGDCCEQRKGF